MPNSVARSLRSRQTSMLALLVTDIVNSFWTTIARGVEDEASAHGFVVLLCNTDEDPAKEERYVDMLLRRRVDGLLIGPTTMSAPMLRRLAAGGVPFVLLDRTVEGIEADVVRSDSRGGAARLTEHLLATGYRRIAYIGSPLAMSTGTDRLVGYVGALASANVEFDHALVKVGTHSLEGGYSFTREMLELGTSFDAIFAGNNLIAMGALHALSEAGVRVPEDVALVTFDDIAREYTHSPFLTAAVQPAHQMGQTGARLLLNRIGGKRKDTEVVTLETQIVIRTSCGCAAKDGRVTSET